MTSYTLRYTGDDDDDDDAPRGSCCLGARGVEAVEEEEAGASAGAGEGEEEEEKGAIRAARRGWASGRAHARTSRASLSRPAPAPRGVLAMPVCVCVCVFFSSKRYATAGFVSRRSLAWLAGRPRRDETSGSGCLHIFIFNFVRALFGFLERVIIPRRNLKKS